MTPQEIVDYKRKWMGYSQLETKIHSDWTGATRCWLKDHVPKQQYHVQEHTNCLLYTSPSPRDRG